MEKPFEGQALVERYKAKGLDVAEDLAMILVGETFDWVNDSCAIHENATVKTLGVAAVGILKPIAMGFVDKIDGKVG